MAKIKKNIKTLVLTILIAMLLSVVSNLVGYNYSIIESIPGLLILAGISLLGYLLSYLIPTDKISAVLWISFIAIFLASPISPVAEPVIYYVNDIQLMAVVTPILGYSGVLVAKDWQAFLDIGVKGIIVSIFVISGTFFISGLLADLIMSF